jgi:hypothetical protein
MKQDREKRRRIIRVDRICGLLKDGVDPADIDRKLQKEIEKVGRESEYRARQAVEALDIVRKTYKSTWKQDLVDKIDFTTLFVRNSGHKPVTVQVKSSEEDVKAFLDAFELDERGAVLAAGPSFSVEEIQESFLDQLLAIDGYI